MTYVQPSAFDLLEEAKWEMEGTRRAAEEYRKASEAADAHTLPSGQKLLREIIPMLIEEITKLQLQGADMIAQVGRAPEWAWPIQLLGAKEMSLITLVCGLNAVRDQAGTISSLTSISLEVAMSIRDEIEYRRWVSEQVASNKIAKEEENWEHRDILAAFRARYPNANRKVWGKWRRKVEAARTEAWDKRTSVGLGSALLSALCEAAPTRFEVATRPPHTTLYLRLSEETQEMMLDIETRRAVATPLLLPMIIPPIPWRYV